MKKTLLVICLIHFSILSMAQCPQLFAAMIDACNGPSVEGDNEFMMIQNGNTDLLPSQYKIYYSSDNPPATGSPKNSFTHLTGTYTTAMSTYIDSLNIEAANTGCPNLFATTIPATGIPANSLFLVLSPKVSLVYNLNAYCNKKPLYVLFDTYYNANNACADMLGNSVGPASGTSNVGYNRCGTFKNYSAATTNKLRYFSISTTIGCADNIVSYDFTALSSSGTAADGAWVSWGTDGTPSYLNNGCEQIIIVPVKLMAFDVAYSNNKANLFWQTSMETNTSHFKIEKSYDGINFFLLDKVTATGNSSTVKNYLYTDNAITKDVQYYRLATIDMDGRASYSKIIKLNIAKNISDKLIVSPLPAKNFISLEWNSIGNYNATLLLTDIAGKQLKKEQLRSFRGFNKKILTLNNLPGGQYILQFSTQDNVLVQKIIIN